MNRYKIRENTFILVFEKIFTDYDIDYLIEIATECDQFELDQEIITIFGQIEDNKDKLDDIISKHLNKWTISRIPKITLAILRVAIYEIIYSKTVDPAIAINEAVNLAKLYSTKDDASFVNGVLGSFVRETQKKDQ